MNKEKTALAVELNNLELEEDQTSLVEVEKERMK
jgi:hypothetical protein